MNNNIVTETVRRKERNVLVYDDGKRQFEITNEYGPKGDMAVYLGELRSADPEITEEDIERVKKLIIEQKPFEELPVVFA